MIVCGANIDAHTFARHLGVIPTAPALGGLRSLSVPE